MKDNIQQNKLKNYISKTFLTCFISSLSGLLFGLDIGTISGILPLLINDFKINYNQQELIISSMMLGSTIGTIIAGWISKKTGRKHSLLVSSVLFIIGSIISYLSTNIKYLIYSRIISGISIGISSYITPIYLSEIAPKQIRGSMISMYQLMITIGILIAYFLNLIFNFYQSWRIIIIINSIPAIISLITGIIFLPGSPRWLASKGKYTEAKNILYKLRKSKKQAKKELKEIINNLKTKQNGWNFFKKNKNFRKVVYLGILMQIMQQFSGMNAIIYYAPKIFNITGFANINNQIWGMIAIGITNVITTLISISLVDKWGRRPTLKLGFFIMAISMGSLGTLIYIEMNTQLLKYLSILILITFTSGFSISAGPLIWVLCSEIQPIKGKDFGITISTTTNWIANMIVGYTFLSMLNQLGTANTFWIYCIFNIIFMILTIILIPETKNISLEKIEQNLMIGKSLRNLGSK